MQGDRNGRREKEREIRNCRPNTAPLQEQTSWDPVASLKSHQRCSELPPVPGSPRPPGPSLPGHRAPAPPDPPGRAGHQRHSDRCPHCPACLGAPCPQILPIFLPAALGQRARALCPPGGPERTREVYSTPLPFPSAAPTGAIPPHRAEPAPSPEPEGQLRAGQPGRGRSAPWTAEEPSFNVVSIRGCYFLIPLSKGFQKKLLTIVGFLRV